MNVRQMHLEAIRSRANSEPQPMIDLTRQLSRDVEGINRSQQDTAQLLAHLLRTATGAPPQYVEKDAPPGAGEANELDPQYKPWQEAASRIYSANNGASTLAMPVKRAKTIQAPCDVACNCTCHQETALSTPRLLGQITGRLFVGCSGSFLFQRGCSATSCRNATPPSANMVMFFPSWFLQRAVSASFQMDAFGTPNLSLKVRRVVAEASDLFSLAKCGDVGVIKALFSKGEASPDDVHCCGGWSALHVRSHRAT